MRKGFLSLVAVGLLMRVLSARGQTTEQLDDRLLALDRQVGESKDAGTLSPQRLEGYKTSFKKLFLELGQRLPSARIDEGKAQGLARLRVGHFPRGGARKQSVKPAEERHAEKPRIGTYRISCWSCVGESVPRKSVFQDIVHKLDTGRAGVHDPGLARLWDRVLLGARQASALEKAVTTRPESRDKVRVEAMREQIALLANELQVLTDLLLAPPESSVKRQSP